LSYDRPTGGSEPISKSRAYTLTQHQIRKSALPARFQQGDLEVGLSETLDSRHLERVGIISQLFAIPPGMGLMSNPEWPTIRPVFGPSKERVIEGLVGGKSITAAAKAGKVSRQTVHRWLRDDFEFQAELNSARADLRVETENRLFALAIEAIGAVENAIQQGDASVGLSILKGLGLLPGKPRDEGSESPSALRSQAATRELLELI